MTQALPRIIGQSLSVFALVLLSAVSATRVVAADRLQIGVSKIDITPRFPIRLTGYASRQTESEGTEQKLWAKALAIGSRKADTVVLITVDNCGVCANVTEEVAARLKKKAGLERERLAVCSSHSHTGPCIVGFAPNIFAKPIPEDQQERIDRYTKELTDKLERVALAALKGRRPGKLAWAKGEAGFARNRRTTGGPVDHALPILRAVDLKGNLRAVVANYACHCTTLGGDFNKFCGDWVGYAGEYLERENPGAIALVTIGCGADSNPYPRGGQDGGLELARQHGQEIASQTKRLLEGKLQPLLSKIRCQTSRIQLPFQSHFTREQWEQRAKQSGIVGYHATKYLARLDRGEKLPATLPYLVQTWIFGDDLAMVFLAGEVVVDYSLRLKREFDGERLWINAYANDVPCYIPSKRILGEGGYEAEESLWYYDRPARLAPESEDLIIKTVHDLLPKQFLADPSKSEFPPPKSPTEALASMRTHPSLTVELVASEPEIVDPVAIDWGADGKLWVVEMHDYPTGIDGKWKPGGRIKFLEDRDGDGRYERATLFLENLPFPTGVMAWRKGALICAAPDILYAEDTNGDGQADVVKKIFSGFYTDNYQARVNSLSLGLDNWIYGANGLLGGVIRGNINGKEVNIRGQDFRMNPDTGAFERASGLTQQGRVRDDWGNWFGCDNSTLLRHYPMEDRYLLRNPHIPAPDPSVFVPSGPDPNHLFPASRTLTRYNDPGSANRTTSACGLGLYRDELLGTDYAGNAFVCEPVHNLVHRLVLETKGVTFTGHRASDEESSEFLASTDNWFRPVQVRTGPDGALWIVDMYRYLIEHPRWIPPSQLSQIDVRAGDDKGRIYRVYPKGKKLRSVPNYSKLETTALVASLDTPNGTARDMVHLELVHRGGQSAVAPLRSLLHASQRPECRMQTLCVLDGLGALSPDLLEQGLSDSDARVREQAIRLSEPFLSNRAKVPSTSNNSDAPGAENVKGGAMERFYSALLNLKDDAEVRVRYQLALSLGESNDARASKVLGDLLLKNSGDQWFRAAVLSSASRHSGEILAAALSWNETIPEREEVIAKLIATAAASEDEAVFLKAFTTTLSDRSQGSSWQLAALASFLDALDRKTLSIGAYVESHPDLREYEPKLRALFDSARSLAKTDAPEAQRENAIHLVGRGFDRQREDLQFLNFLLSASNPEGVRKAALETFRRSHSPEVAPLLLSDWKRHSPAQRAEILNVLLSREEWMAALVAAINQQIVGVAEISLSDRQRLLKHPNEEIRNTASALFAESSKNREQVLQGYQSVKTLKGDATKGADLFSKNCATCHAFRGQGHEAGPNLAALRDKEIDYWLKNILDPNAVIEPRFVSYSVETKDGRSLTGIVIGETSTSLTLAQSGGIQERVLRSDIAEMRASALSLMPEGLENALPPQELADLLAYLKAGPARLGSTTEEQAAQARAKLLAEGANGLGKILFSSERLPYPSWLGVLPMPHCRQTDGQSKIVWQTLPVPSDAHSEALYKFRLPAGMGYLSQPAGKFHLKLNDKALLDFDVTLNDQTWQSKEGSARMTYTVMQNNAEDSNGVLVIEVKGELLEAGKPVIFEVIGQAARSERWFGIYLWRSRETIRAFREKHEQQHYRTYRRMLYIAAGIPFP